MEHWGLSTSCQVSHSFLTTPSVPLLPEWTTRTHDLTVAYQKDNRINRLTKLLCTQKCTPTAKKPTSYPHHIFLFYTFKTEERNIQRKLQPRPTGTFLEVWRKRTESGLRYTVHWRADSRTPPGLAYLPSSETKITKQQQPKKKDLRWSHLAASPWTGN